MTDKFYIEKFENILFSDIKKRFQINKSQSYYRKLYEYYFQYNKLNDLQKFRSIPNYFKKIKHNWILIYEKKLFTKVLAGHAVMCEINYNVENDLPENGWTGSIIKSFKDDNQGKEMNTLVGLFVHIEKKYREKNVSKILINQMRDLAKNKNKKLIIPLRPPTRFTKKYCEMDFADYAKLQDQDGNHIDYWVKIHMKFGAKYLNFCETSHQHKIDTKNFKDIFGKFDFNITGYYVAQILGGFHNIYFNKETDLITINQGCIWVQHEI